MSKQRSLKITFQLIFQSSWLKLKLIWMRKKPISYLDQSVLLLILQLEDFTLISLKTHNHLHMRDGVVFCKVSQFTKLMVIDLLKQTSNIWIEDLSMIFEKVYWTFLNQKSLNKDFYRFYLKKYLVIYYYYNIL